jgi:hypothetical protein
MNTYENRPLLTMPFPKPLKEMTNEELAIGKRLSELQVKKDNVLDKEKDLIDEEKADD